MAPQTESFYFNYHLTTALLGLTSGDGTKFIGR
jgi:hypothetical protein